MRLNSLTKFAIFYFCNSVNAGVWVCVSARITPTCVFKCDFYLHLCDCTCIAHTRVLSVVTMSSVCACSGCCWLKYLFVLDLSN